MIIICSRFFIHIRLNHIALYSDCRHNCRQDSVKSHLRGKNRMYKNKKIPETCVSWDFQNLIWWRRRRDSNPRTALTAYTLSRGTSYSHLSTSPLSFKTGNVLNATYKKRWPRGWDSNPRGLAP